jgi:hypothetical protein
MAARLQPGDVRVIVPRRLRAPTEDRAVVADPPLADVGSVLAINRARLAKARFAFAGRSLLDFRQLARQGIVAAAQTYMAQAGDSLTADFDAPLFFAGHQPELFHPGVWVKNFALHGIARKHGAIPINLIVDNDTAKTTSLRVPVAAAVGTGIRAATTVGFDRWVTDVPYEERPVLDEDLFGTFAERASNAMADWGFRPLLAAFWAEARQQAQRTRLLGERLAAARRSFERAWGCHNLEVPVSSVCHTEPFAWFVCHLLADLPRFHATYNESVHAYRRLYRIRSRSHPVPDLATDGDWLEMPLWIWRSAKPRRGRLFARPGPAPALRLDHEAASTFSLGDMARPEQVVASLTDLERRGFKVRSRALTNTLYARLFVGDLFIHGIGGAKYDELTDEIIRRFYQVEPPGYLTLSATLLLPLPLLPGRLAEQHRLEAGLRDWQCNPQRHLDDGLSADPETKALAAEKEKWIGFQPRDRRGRRERYRALKDLTARLFARAPDRESQWRDALHRCTADVQVNAVRQHRDYAFCLFPEHQLREFCTRFLRVS